MEFLCFYANCAVFLNNLNIVRLCWRTFESFRIPWNIWRDMQALLLLIWIFDLIHKVEIVLVFSFRNSLDGIEVFYLAIFFEEIFPLNPWKLNLRCDKWQYPLFTVYWWSNNAFTYLQISLTNSPPYLRQMHRRPLKWRFYAH